MNSQIQFETNGLTVLAVNIAPDASEIRILDKDENYCKKGDLVYKTSQNVWGHGDHVLPDGKWKLHALTDSMTEEQAKVLVLTNGDSKRYLDYPLKSVNTYFESGILSLHSLLRSHGIDPTKKWVLLTMPTI